jgi:vacuolar protein 8
MERIEGLVRALREGDDAAKTAAAEALADDLSFFAYYHANIVAEAGGIAPLVELLRDGSAEAKLWAAMALGHLACNRATNQVLIAEAGGIAPLVELLRDGSAGAEMWAAWALGILACNDANRVLIAEAGAIPRLVELLRDGSAEAKFEAASALCNLAHNNDANAVAIAAAVGFDAVVELARSGSVTFDSHSVVEDAGVPAKREAALKVAALLRDYVPEFNSVPDVLMAAIVSYL